MQEQQMQQQQEMQQAQMEQAQMQQEIDLKKHDDEIAVKREKIQADLEIAAMKEMNNNYRTESGLMDSDNNGIADVLDRDWETAISSSCFLRSISCCI